MTAVKPNEFASVATLAIHPFAGAAAVSALGLGLASQAFGLWFGLVTGAAEAAQRLFSPASAGTSPVPLRSPAAKAESAARALIEEARRTATEIAAPAPAAPAGPDPVARVADPTPAVEPGAPGAPAEAAPAGLMPEDFRPPLAMEKPKKPDDLKRIAGIGPKLEAVLNGLGIWTFAQIAAWGGEEVAWMDDYLAFKGRIGRDRWIEQAAALSAPERGRRT